MNVDQIKSMREDRVLFNMPGYGEVLVPGIPHKDREYGGHLIVKPADPYSHHVSDLLDSPQTWCRYHLLCAITEKAMLEVLPCLNGTLPYLNKKFSPSFKLTREFLLALNPKLTDTEIKEKLELLKNKVFIDEDKFLKAVEEASIQITKSNKGLILTYGRMKGIINLVEAGNWGVHFHRDEIGLKGSEGKKIHAHLYGRSIYEPCATKIDRILHWGWGEAPFFPMFVDTPFSPKKSDKDWIVPEQFNTDECKDLETEINNLFQRYQSCCP